MKGLVEQYPVSSPEEMAVLIQRNKQNGWEDLPAQKRAFAMKYIIDYKHRGAAVEVGYSADHGIQLLRDPIVAAYIATLQEIQHTSDIITKDFINANYLQLLEMAMGEVDINMVLPNGDEISAKKTSVSDATNILKELSKSTEYERDTGMKTAPVNIQIDFGAIMNGAPPVVIEGEIDNG